MRVERSREMLRVLERTSAEQMAWLMRVHAALLFPERRAEALAHEPTCPDPCGEDPLLAPLARLWIAMTGSARRLFTEVADFDAYQAFVAAVEAFVRETRRMEAYFRRQLLETDPLTGIHNRQGMLRDIRREWTRALRTGRPVCVAIADLDFFKNVNDTWGHAAGDRVLCMAARFFARRLRPYDMVFRYGGEEFLICLPDTDSATARAVLDRLRGLMARLPVALDCGSRVAVTCSIGVAQMVPGRSVHQAIAAADRALYVAKESGRNRVVLAPPPSSPGLPAVAIAERLHPARNAVRH